MDQEIVIMEVKEMLLGEVKLVKMEIMEIKSHKEMEETLIGMEHREEIMEI